MRIAHLSDVHLIADRSARFDYRLRRSAVRFGRSPEPRARADKLARALGAAAASGADHLVISGDLTELGDDAEFELFAEVLSAARLAPEDVTLVPGNHDAYTSERGWARALAGPLAPWAASSAGAREVRVVDRGDVVLLAADVTRFQSVVWSGGELTRAAAEEIDRRLSDPAIARRTAVLAIHHPPFAKHEHPAYRLVDSLRGAERVSALLQRHPNLHLVHGHFHRALDRPRSFGAPAVADDAGEARVRLYEAAGGTLASAGIFTG